MFFVRLLSLVVIISLSSVSMARAQCVVTAHAGTIADVGAEFLSELFLTTAWIQFDFVPQEIQPAFANMARQWSISDQEYVRKFSSLIDSHQQQKTQMALQNLEAESLDALQPDEEMCSRISYSSNYLASSFKADSTKKSLLQASLAQQTGMPGTAGAVDNLSYGLARFDYFTNHSCIEEEIGGVMTGLCAASDDVYINADISPEVHFGSLTVESNDASSPDGHLHAYVENMCGGFSLSLLPAQYFTDFSRKSLLLDVYEYWQYEAFCREALTSYASMKAPGPNPITPEQMALLSDIYSPAEMEAKYGTMPSQEGQLDIVISSSKSPLALGNDQVVQEKSLMAYDVMNLASDFLLVDQYHDLISQETRSLGLYLGISLKDQRKKANTGLLLADTDGKKS